MQNSTSAQAAPSPAQAGGVRRLEVHERYLPPEVLGEARIVGIKSPMGTGKTEALVRYLQGERADLLIPLRSLERVTAERLGRSIPDVVAAGDFIDEDRLRNGRRGSFQRALEALARHGIVCGTYHRYCLGFFDQRDPSDSITVIDEAMALLMVACWASTCAEHRRSWFEDRLKERLSAAKQVILLDAALDYGTVELLARLLGREADAVFVENAYRPQRGQVTFHASSDGLTHELREAIRDGEPSIYLSSSIFDAESMARACQDLSPLLITSRTVGEPKQQEFIREAGRVGGTVPRLVVASPVICSGLSIDVLPDGSPAFQRVFVNAQCWPGGVSVADIRQMAGRVRGAPQLDIYLRTPRQIVQTREQIQADLIRTWEQTGEALRGPRGIVRSWASLVSMAVHLRHLDQVALAAGPEGFAASLRTEGYSVSGEIVATPEESEGLHHALRAQEKGGRRHLIAMAPRPPRTGDGQLDQAEISDWVADCGELGSRCFRTASEVVVAAEVAAQIREVAALPEDAPLDPNGLLVEWQIRYERVGGLRGRIEAIEARSQGLGIQQAKDADAWSMGMEPDPARPGAYRPRQVLQIMDGELMKGPAEACAPQDARAHLAALELRLECLAAGQIDLAPNYFALPGVRVERERLEAVWQALCARRSDAERLEIVRRVGETWRDGAKNVATLLAYWGLGHGRPARNGAWLIRPEQELVDILARRQARREEQRRATEQALPGATLRA